MSGHDHATTAARAEVAEVAGIAESANPMAYAYVRANGSVDPARSFGITDADNVRGTPLNGRQVDCYLGPIPKAIQITVEYTGSGGGDGVHPGVLDPVAYAGLGNGYHIDLGCPDATKLSSTS